MRPGLGFCAVCLVVLLGSSARAETPAGEYTIAVSEDDGLVFPSGVIEELCVVDPADQEICVSGDVATDASGAVTGSAALILTGPISLDLALVLDGRLAGSTLNPKAVIDFSAAGIALVDDPNQPTDPNLPPNPPLEFDVDGSGRMKCKLDLEDPEQLLCTGKARLCVFDEDGKKLGCDRLPFATPLDFVRTPFDIHLDLATDAKNVVAGDAEVLIGAAPVFAYTAKGKYKPTADTTNLKLASADTTVKTKIALKKVQLAGGAAGGGAVVFKIAGQKGAVLLTPLTLKAHGVCARGGFCDVNDDTALLFTGSPSPLLPGDTIFFGILQPARY